MSGLYLVNSLDVARALGPELDRATPESVCDFLLTEYLRPRVGGFNHDPAIASIARVFDGSMSTNDAIRFCAETGNPKGRTQNAEIVQIVGPYAERNRSTVYRHGFLAVAVGRYNGKNIYVGLKAPFTRVCHDEAFVVIPGFRKSFLPSDAQLRLPCSLAALQLARGDYRKADIEYLYAGPSPNSSDRMLRVIRGARSELLDANQLDHIFDVYVRGVVLALDQNAGTDRPDLSGYRIVDPNQPSIFD